MTDKIMHNERMNVTNVLWTGGLDSTYLLVKLLYTKQVILQPYYIIDRSRKSYHKELEAMKNISKGLIESPSLKGKLLDVITVEKVDIKQYPDITESWKVLNEKYTLGTQYDWLARFARERALKLMVGVQMETRGKVVHTLEGKEMEIINNYGIECYATDGVADINDCARNVYENILFPCLIVGTSKQQEWKELHDMGFGDVAAMTWFCHRPILGLTCGHCNPCMDALHEGMGFRVSRLGRLLGGFISPIRYVGKLCFSRSRL